MQSREPASLYHPSSKFCPLGRPRQRRSRGLAGIASRPGSRPADPQSKALGGVVHVNSGVDLLAAGKVLSYARYQTAQRYSHLANDTLRAAVEVGAAKQKVA
jgi:hypothetical protein